MTVNGVSTDTTGHLPWAGALAFPVGDPLPKVHYDPALRDERPSMGMRLRRVK